MDMTSITPQIPSKCHLWTKDNLAPEDFRTLKQVERYIDDDHLIRDLMKCTDCGQHYYKEFYETTDYVAGNDPQYRTYIPIKPTPGVIKKLNALDIKQIHTVTPRLLDDWLADDTRTIKWIGKSEKPALASDTKGQALIIKATKLAIRWHEGQIRKGDGSPYIEHPKAVAFMLAVNGFSAETIAAGYCHDLLEDTECSEEEILEKCGSKVLEIVESVTNDETLPWKEKKLKYIATVKIGSDDAKAVCVTDKIHNLESLLKAYKKYGPSIWSNFNKGKKEKLWFEKGVLKMLQDTWNHPLIAKYERSIKKMEKLADQEDTQYDFNEKFKKKDTKQLRATLELEIKNSGCTIARDKYIAAIKVEIMKRGGSYSIDPLFVDAVRLVLKKKVASVSLIKRGLDISHIRASTIFVQLKLAGIVGKFDPSNPRNVFVREAKKYLKDK